MKYRIFSIFCVAFAVAISLPVAANGSANDSLLSILYKGLVKEEAERYELLCRIAANCDNADTIVKYCNEAIRLAEKLDARPAQPAVLKGIVYLDAGDLASALACFIQAANLYREDNNNRGQATAYVYMAEAYNKQGNHENEKYYLNDAIEIFRKEKDSINLAKAMHNLGYTNYTMGRYDTALVLFLETSEIYKNLDDPVAYAIATGNSGLVYSRQSEFEKAEDFLLRAIDILNEQNDDHAITEYMIEYAGILQQKGEIAEATDWATTSFLNAAKHNMKEYERDAALRLAQLYQIAGRYDSAYHYQTLYINANDSLKSYENIQKMADLRTEFEVAKKQAEVDVLQKSRLLQLIVIVGLTLILLLAVGLIILYYHNLKRSRELSASLDERRILLEMQSKQLKEKQDELLLQKAELQNTLENLQKTQEQLIESEKMAVVGGLVAGVAHEMSTPVGIGITAISNLLDDVQKMAALYEKDRISREDFKGFLESTNETARLTQKNLERADSLIQSFKQVSSDQITEQQRFFVFREYLNDILSSLKPKFRGKKISFTIECDDRLKLHSYPGVFAQIFSNLLLNSLQHGFADKDAGLIFIKVRMENNTLTIQYADDGAGINRNDLPHIFEPFYVHDQHQGTGLGLHIIYNLVRQKLRGTISCESEPGKGVLFSIEVPVQ